MGPERAQREAKAELIMDAIAKIGIDAMTVGDAEFAFGKDFLLANAQSRNLPYLCANLIDPITGQRVFPATRLKDVGGIKVGIVGLTREGLKAEGLQVLPSIPAAKEAVAELKAQGASLLVALSNQTTAVNEQLAREVPELDLIVVGSVRQKLDSPNQVGNALILEAGNRGKFVGILDMSLRAGVRGWYDPGAAQRGEEKVVRFQERLASLEERITQTADGREKDRLQKQLEFYQSELQKARGGKVKGGQVNTFVHDQVALSRSVADDPSIHTLVGNALKGMENSMAEPAHTTERVPEPAASAHGKFVGAKTCMGCHSSEYQQWSTTGHALAYTTLEKLNRTQDYQCYTCHITGHGMAGGPTDPKQVGELKGVQCESCHMAGRDHVANPSVNKLPAKVPEVLCVTCHTPEQTEGRFIYAEYLPKVAHGAASSGMKAGSAGLR